VFFPYAQYSHRTTTIAQNGFSGAVYTATNNLGSNSIVVFDRHATGDALLVTEKLTNRPMDRHHLVSRSANAIRSSSRKPFAGAPNASAVSSYQAGPNASLSLIAGSVPTTETAACWLVVSKDGLFAYAANAASGSITGYRISVQGNLQLLNADGRTGVT